ncbi:MAG TPA: energy transducer TonB [Bacteroidetes bacterium]|nr:energy transducer TonB [Bacteroidota bacterium]
MKFPDKDKRKALIGTVIFHGLLIVALMFLALRTPLPLPGEQGVEVNLGNAVAGLGKKAMKTVAKTKPVKKPVKPVTKPAPAVPKPHPKPLATPSKNLTQNVEKAPSLPAKTKKAKKKPEKPSEKKAKKKPTQKPHKTVKKTDSAALAKNTPPKKPEPVVNRRALFKVAQGNQNQSQGIKPGSGDMGKPHGFKQSNAYNGQGGQGHGIAFSLGNRGAKFLDKPVTRFTEQGTVVVRIEVNPKGQVINARVFAKGTTVVSEQLRKRAVESAKNSLFSADPSAPAVQIGTITYHFILKK